MDLDVVTKGTSGEVAGVARGAELVAYADAVVARSEDLRATRDAVQKALGDAELSDFERALGLSAIQRAQAGLLADMDLVADALYGR